MRILLITQGISRIVYPVLNCGHQVVGILESMPRGYKGLNSKSLLIRLLKMVYGIIMRKDLFLSDFCRKRNIPYNFLWKNNAKEVAFWVENLKPDLIVIFSMSQLLKDEFLRIPKHGVINLHPSFLPDYRGPNPDFWQYYNMEMNPGATVHYVNAGEDTGDIIFQEKVSIPIGTKSPARLNQLIGELGVALLLKAIDAIAQNNPPRIPQPKQSPTVRARNLKLEEHPHIIDWEHWPIERVWHVLRGTELWLNAIEQPSGLMTGQRWSIQEYKRTDGKLGETGKIGKYKNKKCVFTKDGLIYISIDFDIKKTIVKIFYG